MRPVAAQANESSCPDQLDLFQVSPLRGDGRGDQAGDGSAPLGSLGPLQAPRAYQLAELPGETFEDIFGDAA